MKNLAPLVASLLSTASSFAPAVNRAASTVSLVMKRPGKRVNTESIKLEQLEPPSELPANLKRHITAKRPTLGHIVPKNAKSRQYKNESGGSSSAKLRSQGVKRDTARYNNPSNLRILGGSYRGRKLDSPSVYLRPMMGKVKEAVYSTFTSFGFYEDMGGKPCTTRHLDIFSGSGSVGLESLSRGAKHCTFVDMSPECCDAARRNIDKCLGTVVSDKGEPVANVICTDAYRALRQPESVGIEGKYDLVTLCPPYEEIVYAELVEAVANSCLVTDDTVILVEYPVELGCMPHVIGRKDGGVLIGIRNRKYGRTVIAMYIVNPTGERDLAESRPEEFIKI